MLDESRFVTGDLSSHVDLLQCELISDRSHIHGWNVEPHYHDGLAQIFVFSDGVVEANLQEQERSIVGPAIVWVPPLFSHGFNYPRDMDGYVITAPMTDIFRIAQQRSWVRSWLETPCVIEADNHRDLIDRITILAGLLQGELKQWSLFRNDTLETLLIAVLNTIARCHALSWGAQMSPEDRSVQIANRFFGLLDNHYLERRSVAQYAEELDITPTHLSRILTGVTGKSANAHISARVLLDAKRALLYSSSSVAEISEGLGFATPSYFIRFFRRHETCTPAKFRAQANRPGM